MKKLLIIFLLFVSIKSFPATLYVSPSGSNSNTYAQAQSQSTPWQTLNYATSMAQAGDIIWMMDGSHTLAAQASWGVNIWITGSSKSNVTVNVTYTGAYPIYANGGTNSSQSISNITFTGNSKNALYCIGIYNRNNVEITGCDFSHFKYTGLNFWSDGSWRTGNSVIHCNITDCASGKDDGYGDETYALKVNHQQGFDCGYNYMNETIQTVYHAGIPIGGLEGNRGLIFHNNEVHAHTRLYSAPNLYWTFAMEFWYVQDMEMYSNRFYGEVDMGAGVSPYATSYGLYSHDNHYGFDSDPGVWAIGLQLEQYASGVISVRDKFTYLEQGIYFCNNWPIDKTDYVENMYIMSDIFYGIGTTGTNSGFAIRFEDGSDDNTYYPPTYYNNINIINCTMIGSSGITGMHYGIDAPTQGRTSGVTNLRIQNNIIMGFSDYAIALRVQDNDYGAAITNFYEIDNLCYNNGNSNNTYVNASVTISGGTREAHIKNDPLFISSPTNLKLSSTSSPAYHAGTAFSFTYNTGDFENNAWYSSPSIGAYEYSLATPPVIIDGGIIYRRGSPMMKRGHIIKK